jgi:hypothetical protein
MTLHARMTIIIAGVGKYRSSNRALLDTAEAHHAKVQGKASHKVSFRFQLSPYRSSGHQSAG